MAQQKLSMILFLGIFLLIQSTYEFEINVRYTDDPTLQVFRIESYVDESVLIRVVKDIGGDCSEQMLRIRIVHPNGTITPMDISLSIPDFNYCLRDFGGKVEKEYGIHVYSSIPGFLLVTYLNTTDVTASPAVFGLIINWQGEILS